MFQPGDKNWEEWPCNKIYIFLHLSSRNCLFPRFANMLKVGETLCGRRLTSRKEWNETTEEKPSKSHSSSSSFIVNGTNFCICCITAKVQKRINQSNRYRESIRRGRLLLLTKVQNARERKKSRALYLLRKEETHQKCPFYANLIWTDDFNLQ